MNRKVEELRIKLKNGHLVVLIGSGVTSYTSNNEHKFILKEFLEKGFQKCVNSGRLKQEEVEFYDNLISSDYANVDDYLCVSDVLLDHLKADKENDDFKIWLNETMDNLVPKKCDLIKAIEELDCPILTTNYDLFLETILNRKPLTWSKYQNENISFDDLKNYILHIHGYYEQPESIVISRDNYNELLKNEFTKNVFENSIFTKTLLLVGYDTAYDPQFFNLIEWKKSITNNKQSTSIYKLIKDQNNKTREEDIENITTINYGSTYQHLIKFINHLKLETIDTDVFSIDSLSPIRQVILQKYLNNLIQEYGTVSILGYSEAKIKLELQKVFVHLKFDPTHPSIKAMKSLAVEEEFKRKIFERNFFSYNEKTKLLKAYAVLCCKGSRNINNLCKNILIEPWLNNLLDQKDIISSDEKRSIKDKVQKLKRGVIQLCDFELKEDCRIRDAYNRFKHLVVLGHPGAGKTTLSKWMIINMAKLGLGIENMLNDNETKFSFKLPILIPIWKYIEYINSGDSKKRKRSLLEFIYENPTVGFQYFKNNDEKYILSELIKESLVLGNTLIILEGLDEIPIYMNRTELINEINFLLEKLIIYDMTTNKISHSLHEQKEICSTIDVDIGNRVIITSRIEGNYFQDINHYVPRLTIEDMSYDALESFCYSYMACINESISKTGVICKSFGPDQLFKDLKENEDILKLAINPQLASVIASIYHQCDGMLPNNRIDLYKKTIDKMIERLIDMLQQLNSNEGSNDKTENFDLNNTIIFGIMQEIAEYLHARSEGLSEKVLKSIIKTNLEHHIDKGSEDLTASIVYLLKVHSGLLTEFGHNSFKFLHRTFQEYLAAMNIIYAYGVERDEDTIVRNISEKIAIPNWRVPLAMAFGMLSKSSNKQLFTNVIKRLLDNEQNALNQFSSFITPYVIVDSINDLSFPSQEEENELVETLLDKLLFEYKNRSGFSRIKEHQDLTRHYFLKLSECYTSLIIEWFYKKIVSNQDYIAAIAKILLELKLYDTRLHELFLKNLHHDSEEYNWSVNAILKMYSDLSESSNNELLVFKNTWNSLNLSLYSEFKILPVILAIYCPYEYEGTLKMLHELCEISSFLDLSDDQRRPFIYYFEEIWGRVDTTYEMAVYLDKQIDQLRKNNFTKFNLNKIYKESPLTDVFLEHTDTTPISNIVKLLEKRIAYENTDFSEKLDILISLIALGKLDFVQNFIKTFDEASLKYFKNRIDQLVFSLTNTITQLTKKDIEIYLMNSFKTINRKLSTNDELNFWLYCNVHLTLVASIECNPINTFDLLEKVKFENTVLKTNNIKISKSEEYNFYSEYFASLFSGVKVSNSTRYSVSTFSDTFKCDSMLFVESILRIGSCVQTYKPIRSYVWPNDVFVFKKQNEFDVPISFFNSINNLNNNFSFIIKNWIFKTFKNDALFDKVPELKMIFALFIFGDMTERSNKLREDVFNFLYPENQENDNQNEQKEFFLRIINTDIESPYYKSRSLCMLAQYYDSKFLELLTTAYEFSKKIDNPSLKFQVLEDILHTLYFKYDDSFAKEIIELFISIEAELIVTSGQINDKYDKIISLVRLVFHTQDNDTRINYLRTALDTLKTIENETEKIEFVIKIRTLDRIFNEFTTEIDEIIANLNSKNYKYYLNSQYGRIFIENKPDYDELNVTVDSYCMLNEVNSLFSLLALMKEVQLSIKGAKSLSDLWIDLLDDPNNQAIIEKIIEIGMVDGLILTSQTAMVIDKLISTGNANVHLIFPYLLKPSNEVLPIIYRWFKSQNENVKNLAALLLCESKWIFAEAVDPLVNILHSDNDQLRYRAQGVFQHPDRQPTFPEKRISVIGENAIVKILQSQRKYIETERIRYYLASTFWNIYWDCPQVYLNLYYKLINLKDTGVLPRNCTLFNKVNYIDKKTWNKLLLSATASDDSSFLQDLFHSVTYLMHKKWIKNEDWIAFSTILKGKNMSELNQHLYITSNDFQLITFIIEQTIYYIDNEHKIPIGIREFIENQIIEKKTTNIQKILTESFETITFLHICNFCVSMSDLNEQIIIALNAYHITVKFVENLLNWLVYRLKQFIGILDIRFNNLLTACLLSLLAAVVQKDDFIYRKVTNSLGFNKNQYIQLLSKVLNNHPYFDARGSSFILITALDDPDPKVLVNSLNIFLDENLVKEYSVIGIPMVRLSPNDFTDQILESLKSESAVKVYELLKIITVFAMNDKIDASKKTRILNYIVDQSIELSSKKPISFYHTDIRIPFSATLEKELYKSWLKIQGLSGKTEL